MLRQGKDIPNCDFIKIGNQAPAKRLPGSNWVDRRKHRQQTFHLGARPHLFFSGRRTGASLFAISVRFAQPTVADLAVSRPGEHAERAEATCTMAANAIERSGVDGAM